MKNKITKFLVVSILVLVLVYIILANYAKNVGDISSKVGYKSGGGELTMKEYYTLAQCIETYSKYVTEEKYNIAYNMLGNTYRNYISSEEYLEKMKNENLSNMEIKDINIVTNTTFEVIGDVSGEEKHYSIVIDNQVNKFSIYPDSFLNHMDINKKITKKKLEVKLIDYTVNTNKCIFNFEFKNNSNNTIQISKSTMHTTSDGNIEYSNEINIDPKTTKSVSIEFDTYYDFPKQIVVERFVSDNKNNVKYSFDLY